MKIEIDMDDDLFIEGRTVCAVYHSGPNVIDLIVSRDYEGGDYMNENVAGASFFIFKIIKKDKSKCY